MSIRSASGHVLGVTGLLVMTACAVGTTFVRPQADAIELGKTTYSQLVARLGKPESEDRRRQNDVVFRQVSYSYVGDAEVPKVPNTMGGRELTFLLVDEVVVGEQFMSSYAADATDFDERKIDNIVKGKTRCDEVVAMLGRPSARATYPAVDAKGESLIGYVFWYAKRPYLQFKMFKKSLIVDCDSVGVVKSTSYSEEGDR